MEPMGHASQPAPEARALTRQEEAARYAPYQALLEKLAELDAYSHTIMPTPASNGRWPGF